MLPDPAFAFVLAFVVGLGLGVLLGFYLTLKLVSWNSAVQDDISDDSENRTRPYPYLEGRQPIGTTKRMDWPEMDEAAFRRRYPKTDE